ncbi:hypothetical protein EST38_g4806 [Candolleomyces aberdarensis]|uniref:Uncharacterized protein n=1 Tax=Candolleomyces aberdarensis TaxID=2316362 RepID=A0A4Q2DNS9_9AGAR|nr:hypothetical protein EST38_g4806 [Candolleomyces aberdarensis]
MSSATTFEFPPEILYAICAQVFTAGLPPQESSLDPIIPSNGIPTGHPSSVPPASWSEADSRHTLANCCLLNHGWYEAAKPWLWHRLEVRLPRTWLALVDQIAWNYEEESVDNVMDVTIKAATDVAIASAASEVEKEEARRLEESLFIDTQLDLPEDAISVDLLSPIPSRNPSPRRLRPKSKSPARWKIVRSISDAFQTAMDQRAPGMYVPSPNDPRPGRYVRHLDFNHFRTIGMRRSIDEGVNSRFVTGDRVQAVLKELPNLTAFGATEYMDGALTLPVLNELFLRGAPSGGRGRQSRGRALMDVDGTEEEDRERRRECKDLEAVDFTGCISAVFVNAFSEFVSTHLLPPEAESSGDDEDEESRRSRAARAALHFEPVSFPGMRRLGLRGVKSILPRYLGPFLLAFSHLTHLDLSGTRITSEILDSLAASPTLRLESLAMARCIKLTSESIKNFLVDSPVTEQLTELNLYGDMTYVSPLTEEDLRAIVTEAPAFVNGELIYLDMSSAPFTKEILAAAKPFPKLRSLGLSHIPNVELKAITAFVKAKAPNVEVLTLINTSPELDRAPPRQASMSLHADIIRPLCTPPFTFSITAAAVPKPAPTRLRVIELSKTMLSNLGSGAGSWRIVRSKGGRGWYVDTASSWVAAEGGAVLRRDLAPDHPFRVEMEKLSDANGNVSSGVGWHARKMEILHGFGMLGREDGLYGAVSFAYQG